MDVHFGASIAPLPFFSATAMYHLFNAAEDYTLVGGDTSKKFGAELDMNAQLHIGPILSFIVGYSRFSPGEIFEETMGTDASSWFYFMNTVNF